MSAAHDRLRVEIMWSFMECSNLRREGYKGKYWIILQALLNLVLVTEWAQSHHAEKA